ncbi:MAG: DUF2269 family protein [Chryseolinea sp.]
MTTQTLYNLCLTTHIIGFILFAGTTVVEFFVFQQFRRLVADPPIIRKTTLNTIARFPPLMGIGIVVTILAGVGMMAITKGVFGEQLWMKIKIVLVVLALLNGIFFRRLQVEKLDTLMENVEVRGSEKLTALTRNLSVYHYIQMLIFAAIITLSVFKLA